MRDVRSARLDNGLTVMTERIPTVRSASLGLWVRLGSRDEHPAHNGIAHLVEHMLFKGTARRSARDIAVQIDGMGGRLDAFTAKEHACYYATVLDEHLDDAFDLLADLMLHPRLDPDDLERERGVVLEEIAGTEDTPEEVLYEHFCSRLWDGHPLGRPILGTRETVSALTAADLRSYFEQIAPSDLIVAAAGNLEHRALVGLAEEHLGTLEAAAPGRDRKPPTAHRHFDVLSRQGIEQVQLYVAAPAPPVTDPDRYVVHLLNALLGGSVSSRLFQSIRERHGLAYSIYSSVSAYSDAGYLWVSAGTRGDVVPRILELILAELTTLRREPPEPEELGRMKDHLKGSLMLGLENTFGRMANLARQEMAFGRVFDLDEILEGIDAVAVDDVRSTAERILEDARICAGLVARDEVAEALTEELSDGLELPGGTALRPERARARLSPEAPSG